MAVCGHFSTVTDPSQANVDFWFQREAVRHIGGFGGRYLRMQAEIDHAQNPGYIRHGIEMVNAAAQSKYGGTGSAAWTRMNGSDVGNPPNTTYDYGTPATYPVWVTGRLSDHPTLTFDYIREMAAMAADFDGDGVPDASDTDDDNDSYGDALETPCGSNSRNAASMLERVDGAFAGADDAADTLIDEALPPGATANDCDSDGYAGSAEASVFASSTGDQDPCGTNGWPADLTDAGGFSANRVNISDLASFVGVPRYLNTNVGTNPGDARWDVVPGSTFGAHINIIDLQSIAFGTAPMLGGTRMFNGPSCPWAP